MKQFQFPKGQAADIRISLKKREGPTHRIELVRQPVGKRHWITGFAAMAESRTNRLN